MTESDTKPKATRERLIDAAMELFREKGYEAAGVAEILARAGVNSGSLYYFFPRKEDLLLAVLQRYRGLLWPVVFTPVFNKVRDPIERVFGVLEGYRQMLIETDCRSGCPIAGLALEMSEKSEAIRVLAAANFEDWRVGIRDCLEEAGDRLPEDIDFDGLATLVLTTMEGGVMLARTNHSVKPFDAGVRQLRDLFNRLLSQGTRQEKSTGD